MDEVKLSTDKVKSLKDEVKLSTSAFTVFFLAILFMIGFMIWPFISALIFGAIIAGLFYPMMEFFNKKLRNRRQLAAFFSCSIIVITLFVPSIIIIVKLSQEVLVAYNALRANLDKHILEDIFFGDGYTARMTKELFSYINLEYSIKTIENLILDWAKQFSMYIFETLNSWISNLFYFFFQVFLMIIAIYALFVDGAKLKIFLLNLSPLPNKDEELIMDKFNQMNYVTIICNGIGGIVQGALAGAGFWFAGIGSILLWSSSMVILAFIPLVGISFIYIPACIYLYFTGKVVASIVLFIYCTGIALITENWFKPKFMGKRVEINSIVVFFSIIGGMSVFGMAGIFYGPLTVVIFLTFVQLYHERYMPKELETTLITRD